MGRGQEISYLEHILWATEAMDGGEKEERKAEQLHGGSIYLV